MLADRLRVWKTAYNTANLPVGMTTPPDSVSKWLVITRAAVFSMTVTSGLIGGLLAVGAAQLAQIGAGPIGGPYASTTGSSLLAVVGLVVAHAANNMINDYFDLEGGVDTEDYVRAQYAPHPILSGWVTKRQLGAAILIANAIDLAILLFLMTQRGPLVAAFALGGLFVSVFYVAPPIRLKHIGLGEPGVFIVWGPLMVVGHVLRRDRPDPGLGLDRLAALRDPRDDASCSASTSTRSRPTAKKGVRTMPVLLGERNARLVAQGLMIAFYPIVLLRRAGRLDRAVGRARRARHPAPRPGRSSVFYDSREPEVAAAQLRAAGRCGSSARRSSTRAAPAALLILGLLLNAFLPVRLPLPWLVVRS